MTAMHQCELLTFTGTKILSISNTFTLNKTGYNSRIAQTLLLRLGMTQGSKPPTFVPSCPEKAQG